MTKPKFYLDSYIGNNGDQKINMLYSFNGQRLEYSTGIKINPKFYRAECNKSSKIKPIASGAPNAVDYNQKLADLAASVISISTNVQNKDFSKSDLALALDKIYKPKTLEKRYHVEDQLQVFNAKGDFISFFQQLIEYTRNGVRLLKKGKNKGSRYTENTIRNYEKTLKAIKRYLVHAKKKTLTFDQINAGFYNKFRDFCFKIEEKEVSTFSAFIKDIKTVMSEVQEVVSYNADDFICPEYEADDVALTLDQIEKIASCDLSNYNMSFRYTQGRLSLVYPYEELDRIRDEFIIGCYSGLRFSDLNSLTIEKVEEGFIRVRQIKTGERVTIPVMERLKPYILKYSNELPSTSYFRFLIGAKEVARLAGLTELIEVRNSKGNQNNIEILELWTQIGTHTCRRSYATNMFKAGVPTLLIMGATGHTTEKSFLKYIKATNEDKAKLLADQYLKLSL